MKLSEAMREGAKVTTFGRACYMKQARSPADKACCCAIGAAMYHKLKIEQGHEPRAEEVREKAQVLALRLNLESKGRQLEDALGAESFAPMDPELPHGLGGVILTLNDQVNPPWCPEGEDPRVKIADALEELGL